MKRYSLILALALVLSMILSVPASADEITDVGTPRAETLICDPCTNVYACPGQFNPYMSGTDASWGMHQLMWGEGLWDVNSVTGETIPTIAADKATHNEDYTEWTIKIREGLKWSDGEALDANDVYYSMDVNMTNEDVQNYSYFNSLFSGYELIDDYTVKITCKAPFTRLMTTLGVNSWGCSFRILPEHVYSKVDDIMSFTDSEPLSADAYKLKDYDELGTWILYERRDDWANTPTGILYGEPGPKYVLFRVFGNNESRIMAMVNNEIDTMNEISYEELLMLLDTNESVQSWYEDYPYANTDDACAKGVFFNCALAPFDDVDVRWALTLCCDWVEVSENIFEGIGRMSALNIPAVSAQVEYYYKPMSEWLTNEFVLEDGYQVWDPDFALELSAALQEDYGYDLSALSEEETKNMFGTGYFKSDIEKATELLTNTEGFEIIDGKWNYNGAPWKIELINYQEEVSAQASRSAEAIADQWRKFGIDVESVTLTEADISNRINLGNFQVASAWSACSAYVPDLYNNISGWDSEVFNYDIGETATGISAYRLYKSSPELCEKITAIVKESATVDPASEECKTLMTEFLKLAAEGHIGITVHAGTKIVPVNTAYWTNFPSANNHYEGPWWWWSNFRFTVARLEPAAK